MTCIHTIEAMRQQWKQWKEAKPGCSVGFVPTMGFLHEGHGSLLAKAREENDYVVLSIFVNPTQFGPNEDFEVYPRDLTRDLALAEQCGVDLVFAPTVGEMYPRPFMTGVTMNGAITEKLCGGSRPGHFDGVALVVTKLFQIVKPDRAYFGMKDAQQVAVIGQLVLDLNMDVTIVPCPTLREADGLAMSSRNVYLSAEERQEALVLSQALEQADSWAREAGSTPGSVKQQVIQWIERAPLARIDYVSIAAYPSLQDIASWPEDADAACIIALAVKFGKTRLIDNRLLTINADRREESI